MRTTRYVMVERRSGGPPRDDRSASRRPLDAALGLFNTASPARGAASGTIAPGHAIVFDASPEEVAAKKAALPSSAMLEPEIHRWPIEALPTHLPPEGFSEAGRSPAWAGMPPDALAAAAAATFELSVAGGGAPLPDAEVVLYALLRDGSQATARGSTDKQGRVSIRLPDLARVAAAVVTPAGGFWAMAAREPAGGSTVECLPLPAQGPPFWWHNLLGSAGLEARERGRGLRIGVVDTGLGPHPSLAHCKGIGAFVGGRRLAGEEAARDVLAHGTHCAAIIAARPNGRGGCEGVAPGCELYAARVFAPGRPANQGDISNAIHALSREWGCHLINLSFGAETPSEIERDAIQDAFEHGTVCFAAAGNAGGPIAYPGAYEEAVSVSALGMRGWGPPGSLSATRLPKDAGRYGSHGLYLANFSCWGDGLGCAGPGVGILSALPDRNGRTGAVGPMDGTSQACPAALAALAVALSKLPGPAYLDLPADGRRSAAALAALRACCRDTGLPISLQGRGVPFILRPVG